LESAAGYAFCIYWKARHPKAYPEYFCKLIGTI